MFMTNDIQNDHIYIPYIRMKWFQFFFFRCILINVPTDQKNIMLKFYFYVYFIFCFRIYLKNDNYMGKSEQLQTMSHSWREVHIFHEIKNRYICSTSAPLHHICPLSAHFHHICSITSHMLYIFSFTSHMLIYITYDLHLLIHIPYALDLLIHITYAQHLLIWA